MKKLILIFLIGIFCFACSAPSDIGLKQPKENTDLIHASDANVQADVIYAVDETALPVPDTPEPVKWLDKNLAVAVTSILGIAYEFLVRKIPTSKTLSIFGAAYKLLNFFIPDKSKNGGTLQIRDKL